MLGAIIVATTSLTDKKGSVTETITSHRSRELPATWRSTLEPRGNRLPCLISQTEGGPLMYGLNSLPISAR